MASQLSTASRLLSTHEEAQQRTPLFRRTSNPLPSRSVAAESLLDLKPSTHSRIAAESHAPSCWAPRDAGAGAASLVKEDVAALEEATQRIDGFEERTRLEAEVVAPLSPHVHGGESSHACPRCTPDPGAAGARGSGTLDAAAGASAPPL